MIKFIKNVQPMYKQNNIRRTKSLEEILDFQYDLMVKSVARYKESDLSTDVDYFSANNKELNLLNPYALTHFAEILTKHLDKELGVNSNYEVNSYTLIDNTYDFGSKNGKFRFRRIKKKFANILDGVDYIGNITFAMYKNEKINIEDGKLRSIHIHFITLKPLSRRRIEKIKKLVKCDRNKGVALKGVVYPLHKAVTYVWHAPFMEYAVIPNPKGNGYRQFKVQPSLKTLYSLYQEYGSRKIYDYTVAGGKFKKIWRELKRNLNGEKI